MNTLILKTAINIAIQLAIIVTGIFLFKNGEPYNNALFTIHKLTMLVYIVLGIFITITFSKQYGLNTFILALIILAIVSTIGLMASGGAMSLNKHHNFMLIAHKVSAVVFIISTYIFSFKVISTVMNG